MQPPNGPAAAVEAVTQVDWTSVIAMVSALLALLGVVVGGIIASRTQRSHWRFSEQAEACANLLREHAGVYMQLASAAHAGTGAGKRSNADFIDLGPWNAALTVVNLLADRDIVRSAHALDEAIWLTGIAIRRGNVVGDNWKTASRTLEQQRLAFVNVARERLGRGKEPLSQLTGRPAADHPVWKEPTPSNEG